MPLDQLLQRDAHGFLNSARVVHVPADVEQLGAGVPLPAELREPIASAPVVNGGI